MYKIVCKPKALAYRGLNRWIARKLSLQVFSRGSGLFGSLGNGFLTDVDKFTKIDLYSISPTRISSGWGHSSIASKLGLIVCGRPFDFISLLRISKFYRSPFPILGRLISRITLYFGEKSGMYMEPQFIFEGSVKEVSSSAGLTILLTESGECYSFGFNRWGQCGVSADQLHVYEPTRINLPYISKIEVGLQHNITVTKTGEVYCWGKGERGQLGDGLKENSHIPVRIPFPLPVNHISAGFGHTAVILSDGTVYIWGKSFSLSPKVVASGVKAYDDQLVPRPVVLPRGLKAKSICSSNFNLVIVAEDGTLWAMGIGEYDRNMIIDPIPVYVYDPYWHYRQPPQQQKDEQGGSYNVDSKGRDDVIDPSTQQVKISSNNNIHIVKGYKRVCLYSSDYDPLSSSGQDSPLLVASTPPPSLENPTPFHLPPFTAFEVVIHEGEASIQPLELPGLTRDMKLVELSVGWIHSLALVDVSDDRISIDENK